MNKDLCIETSISHKLTMSVINEHISNSYASLSVFIKERKWAGKKTCLPALHSDLDPPPSQAVGGVGLPVYWGEVAALTASRKLQGRLRELVQWGLVRCRRGEKSSKGEL